MTRDTINRRLAALESKAGAKEGFLVLFRHPDVSDDEFRRQHAAQIAEAGLGAIIIVVRFVRPPASPDPTLV